MVSFDTHQKGFHNNFDWESQPLSCISKLTQTFSGVKFENSISVLEYMDGYEAVHLLGAKVDQLSKDTFVN